MFPHKDIHLRPIERNDLEALRKMHNEHSTIKNLTDTTLINELQQEKWFESICSSSSNFRLAVVYQEQLIGCVRLDHYDPRNRSIQVGGDIMPEWRGKGYGIQMFSACIAYVFEEMNCHRAYLSVLEDNFVAYNLYKKYGFKEEGRLKEALYRNGKYYDYIQMYLLNKE